MPVEIVEYPKVSIQHATIGGVVVAAVVVLPLLICGKSALLNGANFRQLINLNACMQAIALACLSFVWIKRSAKKSVESATIVAILSSVVAFYIALINNFGDTPNSDYLCIQNGCWNVLQNQLPYGAATGYFLYPPMYAEAMAGVYKAIGFIGKHWHPDGAQTFRCIFYFFQNAQLTALIGLLYSSYIFTIRTGRLTKLHAAMLCAAVITLNYPIKETIQWNQVNLFLTCLIMFACASINKLECWRGLLLSIGIHLKAYPALVLPAWLLSGQRKACVWAVVWSLILFGLTLGPFGVSIWSSYLSTASSFISKVTTQPEVYMLNGSCLYSLVYCSVKSVASLLGNNQILSCSLVNTLCTIARIGGAIWLGIRVARRHMIERSVAASLKQEIFYDDLCDLLSFGLFSGPTTLNHHYVLAVPIILWTVLRSGRTNMFAVLLGSAMILNYQSHNTTWMPLAPVGLIILAIARASKLAVPNMSNGHSIPDSKTEDVREQSTPERVLV